MLLLLLAGGALASAQDDPILTAISGLRSPDRGTRYSSAYTLCKNNDDPRTTEPLLNALDEPDDEIFAISGAYTPL
jgi:hypothetical protein